MARKKREVKIVLVAIATSPTRIKQYADIGLRLFVSSYVMQTKRHEYVVVCGYSVTHAASNAFPAKMLDSAIDQWGSYYGRLGWRFEVRDAKGENPRPVKRVA